MENDKLKKLKEIILDMESLVVAFSGGVDSTFLLFVAHQVLGEKVLAVIAKSSTYIQRECSAAEEFCKVRNIPYKIIVSEELEIPEFTQNPKDRCYYCKRELFHKIKQIAYEVGFAAVADGSNADDLKDYRPGMRATKELFVISPLKDAGFTKQEIRDLSREMGLPTWNKPSMACLASRFPYETEISFEKLKTVEKAEEFLFQKGFRTLRVRHHDTLARIEVGQEEMGRFFEPGIRDEILWKLKELGYKYVTLDLQGYRTGSMNEVLDKEHLKRV
jgi:uncharacterized protein